jgi:hypothetical protein
MGQTLHNNTKVLLIASGKIPIKPEAIVYYDKCNPDKPDPFQDATNFASNAVPPFKFMGRLFGCWALLLVFGEHGSGQGFPLTEPYDIGLDSIGK